jgi:hypothetical protein
MPRELKSKADWLEEHVPNPEPRRPDEKDRVQTIVNDHFPPAGILPLSNLIGPLSPNQIHETVKKSETKGVVDTLAKTVAAEKAANIDQQRRAVRRMGPERLRKMILRIFDDLAHEDYNLTQVADRFGLSKSTLSRFAGAKWAGGSGSAKGDMPDLWRNTAQVLASIPLFREMAERCGILPVVEQTIENSDSEEDG